MKLSQGQLKFVGITSAVAVAFAAGTQFRPGVSAIDQARSANRLETAEFEKVTVTTAGKDWREPSTEKNRSGRVVGMYAETADGAHRKLIQEESPSGGTMVIVPGWINGVKSRIVVALDPAPAEKQDAEATEMQ